MEQDDKSKASFSPQLKKSKTETKVSVLLFTVSFDCLLLLLPTIFAWETEASTFLCGHPEMHGDQEVCLKIIISWVSETLGSHMILLSLWGPEERGWFGSPLLLSGSQVSINQPTREE